MALSDLAVYSEYAYLAMTEVVAQEVEKFNAASRGTIQLVPGMNQGDYSDSVFWAKTSGLVHRRDAYGSGAITAKKMTQLVDTSVKVASGSFVELNKGQMKWIQQNPQAQGAAYGQQLAGDVMADMLNTAVGACYAALSGQAAVLYDGTGDTPDTLNPVMLQMGSNKFGDRQSSIVAWVAHSMALNDYFIGALTNTNRLFKFETINIVEDFLGRLLIMSDIPSLYTAGTPKICYTLGLVPGAIKVEQNDDFLANESTTNGMENIVTTYQQEWSNNISIKGFTWDKANGGKSPNDAALLTATNWDKIVTSNKDLAGVIVKSN
jgi:hypothetical protein